MRKVLFLTTVLAFILTSSVWAADISGTWAVSMTSPSGSAESFDLVIKATGENLAITCSNHSVLQTLEGTGTLKGDAIKMNLKSTGKQYAGVKIAFTGTVNGNKMSGTREIDSTAVSGAAAPGGAGGGAAGGAPGGQAAGGQAAQGRQGGAPAGGQGGASGGAGGPPGGGQGQAAGGGAPAGGQGGAPGGGQGGGGQSQVSNAWTAVKK